MRVGDLRGERGKKKKVINHFKSIHSTSAECEAAQSYRKRTKDYGIYKLNRWIEEWIDGWDT